MEEQSEKRIRDLEDLVRQMAGRIAELEARLGPTQASLNFQPGPPPFVVPKAIRPELIQQPVFYQNPPNVGSNAEAPKDPPAQGPSAPGPPPPEPKRRGVDELEYKVGINGLLRGGAAVIVFALLFLVAMLISRGYLTPPVQFGGELALCAAFIGFGIRKIDEKEDFGQVLIGIGSFGLYASFAGAYAVKHLFSSETLLILYVLVSFANLGLARWRGSQTFLIIGFLGGLAAALLPMQRGNVPLTLGLHFLILIPCVFIVIRYRWMHLAALTWLVSAVALYPSVSSNYAEALRVGALYVNCAVALFAYGKTFRANVFDHKAVLSTAILVMSGLYAIGIDEGKKGSWHAIVLTLIALGVGWFLGDETRTKRTTWFGGLLVFVFLLPLGLRPSVASGAYALEATILFGVALWQSQTLIWKVGLGALSVALGAYLLAIDRGRAVPWNLSINTELSVLALMSLANVSQILFVLRRDLRKEYDLVLVAGGGFLVCGLLRSMFLLFVRAPSGLSAYDIVLIGLGLSGLGAVLVAEVTKRNGFFVLSAILCILELVPEIGFEQFEGVRWTVIASLALSALTIVLFTRNLVKDRPHSEKQVVLFCSGLILSSLGCRLFQLVADTTWSSIGRTVPLGIAFGLLALLWTWMAGWRKSVYTLLCAWVAMVVNSVFALGLPRETSPHWLILSMITISVTSLVSLYVLTLVPQRYEDAAATGTILGFWTLVSSLVHLLVLDLTLIVKDAAAWSTGWVITAIILIVSGFRFHRRHLRYGSLAIFGFTVLKVFLYDLSNLDSLVRVVILLLLGFGMLGGGYWYIIWRKRQETPERTDG